MLAAIAFLAGAGAVITAPLQLRTNVAQPELQACIADYHAHHMGEATQRPINGGVALSVELKKAFRLMSNLGVIWEYRITEDAGSRIIALRYADTGSAANAQKTLRKVGAQCAPGAKEEVVTG